MRCAACGGPLELLGQLGQLWHYRCRDCGMDCNRLAPPGDDDDGEDYARAQAEAGHEEGDE